MKITKEGTKGITLIALVITIIILLILAGVSVATLTGKEGIFAKAKLAKQLTEVSSEQEGIQLIMQMHYLDENNKKYDIGTKLYDRNITNGNKWSIVIKKDTNEVYGTGFRFIPKESDLLDYGKAVYNWIYNENTGETIKLEEDNFVELSYGSNLAIKEGLVFNLDALNMENSDSWGNALLYGFNGVETDENGEVISGFSGEDFNFDGVDDYIEIYSDSDFSKEGITIETYGKISVKNGKLGNIYKGPIQGSTNAFKYSVGNSNCSTHMKDYEFRITGTFYQGINTGTKYQCPTYKNDFHIPLKDQYFLGEAYVTFSLKEDGSFYVLLDGKKVAEDKFGEEYVKNYKKYLSNKEYPITIGRNSEGDVLYNLKIKTYAIRLYNKALTEEEAVENYEKTVAYRDLLNK